MSHFTLIEPSYANQRIVLFCATNPVGNDIFPSRDRLTFAPRALFSLDFYRILLLISILPFTDLFLPFSLYFPLLSHPSFHNFPHVMLADIPLLF
jgi:hypothetical protein